MTDARGCFCPSAQSAPFLGRTPPAELPEVLRPQCRQPLKDPIEFVEACLVRKFFERLENGPFQRRGPLGASAMRSPPEVFPGHCGRHL